MTQPDIEELIYRFSRRVPRNGNESLITLPKDGPYEAANLEVPDWSSFGTLSSLPLEIIDHIFTYLDLQSLSRLASCSHHSRNVVRSFPLYQTLLNSIYPTLAGMSQMHALHWYSCSSLISILHHSACASCGDYAPYVFLLTSERICWFCMFENQAYWLVPLSKAKKLFGLKERDLKAARVLRSLHGAKFIPPVRTGMRERLVAARDAKCAAIQVHGSDDALQKYVRSSTYALADKYLAMWIANAPLRPLQSNPSRMPIRRNRPETCHKYQGMGNILFPTLTAQALRKRQLNLTAADVEAGYWCLGCQARLNDTADAPAWLHGLARQSRSHTEFVEHLQTCYGVAKFLGQQDPNKIWPDSRHRNQVSRSLYGEFGPPADTMWRSHLAAELMVDVDGDDDEHE